MISRISLIIFATLFLQACAHNVGTAISENFETNILETGNLVILDSKVNSYELAVGGSEEVPEWSEKSKKVIDQTISDHLDSNTNLNIIESTTFTEEQMALLEEHVALYDLVAAQHLLTSNGVSMPGWQKLRPEFNSTLGEGLAFIKEETGVDIALLTIAEEYSSSGGRVAAGIALAIISYGNAVMPSGHSLLHLGIIDLETGNLTWTDTTYSSGHSIGDEEGARYLVDKTFSSLIAPPSEEPEKVAN